MRVVTDVREFVQLVELRDVRLLRVSGEVLASGHDVEHADGQTMHIFHRVETDQLEVRCVIEFVNDDVRLMADVSTRYEFEVALEVDPEVLEEFIARVAVMAAYPYVREAIHHTAARLQVPVPVLGLLKAGQIEISDQEAKQPGDVVTLSKL